MDRLRPWREDQDSHSLTSSDIQNCANTASGSDSDEVNSIAPDPGQALLTFRIGHAIHEMVRDEAPGITTDELSIVFSDTEEFVRSALQSRPGRGNDIDTTSGKASVSSLMQSAESVNDVPTGTWFASKRGDAARDRPPSSNSAQASHTARRNRTRPVPWQPPLRAGKEPL